MPTTKSDIFDNPDLMHILYWCVKKLKVPPEIKDDVIQETVLNICKRRICSDISVVGNVKNHMRWVLMGRNTKSVLSRQINLQTNMESAPEGIYEEEFKDDIQEELNRVILSDIERKVLHMHFYEEKTLTEIGKILGCTKEWIRQVKNKALEMCRQEMVV